MMVEQYEIAASLLHGCPYGDFFSEESADRLNIFPRAMEHILGQPDGKDRFVSAVRGLSRAFALAAPHPAALSVREEVGFFQALAQALSKRAPASEATNLAADTAVRQIVSRAVASEG